MKAALRARAPRVHYLELGPWPGTDANGGVVMPGYLDANALGAT